MSTIDIRLNLDDELLAFLDSEVKRVRANSRAGYVTQLFNAMLLGRQGDYSLLGVLVPQLATVTVSAQLQPMQIPQPANEPVPNTNIVDDSLDSMF